MISKNITPLLMVLYQQLSEASHIAHSAYDAALQGKHNQAIGTLLPAERHLHEALALYSVIISLHRHGQIAKGGVQ